LHKERDVRHSPVPTKGKLLPVQGYYKPAATAEFVSVLLLATPFYFKENTS